MNRFFSIMGIYPLLGDHVGVVDATELGEASINGSIQSHVSAPTNGQINAAKHAQHAATETVQPHDQRAFPVQDGLQTHALVPS